MKNKFFNKILNWWNGLDYIELEFDHNNVKVRIPRKYVKIGPESDTNTVTLKDIKKAGYYINNIYPRLVISHPETWSLLVPKSFDNKKMGPFENPYRNLGTGFSNNLFKSCLLDQDIKYIACYGKWFRTLLGIFKTKPYVEIYRSNWILNVPWDTATLDKSDNIVANKEQAVVVRHITTQEVKRGQEFNYLGYVEFEIRWGFQSISAFKKNKERFYTWKDITTKNKKVKKNKKK